MIDDEIDRHQRIDLGWIAAKMLHGVAHGGEIDHGGDSGEVLQKNSAGSEGNLPARLILGFPGGQRLNVLGTHGFPVFRAEQILQQDFQAIRQMGGLRKCSNRCVEAENGVVTVANTKRCLATQ